MQPITTLSLHEIDPIIKNALKEDIGPGDITTDAIFSKKQSSRAELIAKEDMVLAGLPVAKRVFELIDPSIDIVSKHSDGDSVPKGTVLTTITGDTASLLQGERVALNFLQRLCGIATLTKQFVDAVRETRAQILDTRKTTPGLRILEKYAVTCGRGKNHRMGLFDMVLIKDNHIKAAGSITKAVRNVRKHVAPEIKIEVETETLEEVLEALATHPDMIMLDNMDLTTMKKAVAMINKQVLVEASGGVRLNNVRAIAETGVDYISVGALTHSPKAVDISMRII